MLLGPHKYSIYKPINYLGPSHKYYPSYPTYYPTWVFTKILTILLPYWATKLHHLYKKPKNTYLVGKSKKPNKTLYKTCCYTTLLQSLLLHDTFTKPIVARHSYKARCCTAPLQSSLLHDTLKPVATWHSYKARCYKALYDATPLKPATMQHL